MVFMGYNSKMAKIDDDDDFEWHKWTQNSGLRSSTCNAHFSLTNFFTFLLKIF